NGTAGNGRSLITEADTEVTRTKPGTDTLTITTGYDGFTLPGGSPLLVDSTVSFSGINGTTAASSYQFQNWTSDVPPAQDLINPPGVGHDGPDAVVHEHPARGRAAADDAGGDVHPHHDAVPGDRWLHDHAGAKCVHQLHRDHGHYRPVPGDHRRLRVERHE